MKMGEAHFQCAMRNVQFAIMEIFRHGEK